MPIKCVDFRLWVHKRSKCVVCKMDQVQIGNDHMELKNLYGYMQKEYKKREGRGCV
jgi:hypothetical protein